jgi:hypothetical protein
MVKVSLRSFDFNTLKFKQVNDNLYNIDEIIFPTPKLTINGIGDLMLCENKNNKFYLKILELEEFLSKKFKKTVKSLVTECTISLKVPFQYSKPMVRVLDNGRPFNYYYLKQNDEIICDVALSKIWIDDKINYNLKLTLINLLKK